MNEVNPVQIGNSVFVRTVTMYYTGRIVSLSDEWIILEDAAWVFDTGRWSVALLAGTLVEVEPYCDPVAVARAAVVDVTTWRHPLPRDTIR